MRVVASGAFGHPSHKIKVFGPVEGNRVAVEDVNDESQVAVGGQLVSHELAVLPDANDVGDVEQTDAIVGLVEGRRGEVTVILASNFDDLAFGSAPGSNKSDGVRPNGGKRRHTHA